jgi:hypothetical protein
MSAIAATTETVTIACVEIHVLSNAVLALIAVS